MALKDTEIRAAKPADRDYKIAAGGGLYLLVTKAGSKLWKLKFRISGKEKKLALGKYPQVSLKMARQKRDAAKLQKDSGIDPAQRKQDDKLRAKLGAENSFRAISQEYLDKIAQEGRAEATLSKAAWLRGQLVAGVGHRPIADITPPELLAVLKGPESRDKRETARRLRSFAGRVFRYAIATGRATNDPTYALRGALLVPQVKHLSAITDAREAGTLFRAIDGYKGRPATNLALRLTPHVYQRPGEIRKMRWDQLDLKKAVWVIDADQMKQRVEHSMPLSSQSIAILEEMRSLDMSDVYVFPALGKPNSPMSENAIVGALRRLGYGKDKMSAHGFRTTASSLLNESGKWNPDAIERALAHADQNQMRAIYNRSAYWEERVRMAQWWSDYIDQLK